MNKERKTMKNTIKIAPGIPSEDGRAEVEGSQISESEKLADPKKETTVPSEQPKKRRIEITLMPTYKPSRK